MKSYNVTLSSKVTESYSRFNFLFSSLLHPSLCHLHNWRPSFVPLVSPTPMVVLAVPMGAMTYGDAATPPLIECDNPVWASAATQ
jgi:hypothetical protein